MGDQDVQNGPPHQDKSYNLFGKTSIKIDY